MASERAPGAVPEAPPDVDVNTTVVMRFNGSLTPDRAPAGTRVSGNALLAEDGRWGGALRLPEGTTATISAETDLLSAAEGSVELWLRPRWSASDGRKRELLSLAAGEGSYVSLNLLPSGRFGAAFSKQEPGRAQRWRRIDASISEWKPGAWHHVLLRWKDTRAELWIDGREVAEAADVPFPAAPLQTVQLVGSDHDIDELRISDIARNPGMDHREIDAPQKDVLHLSTLNPTAFEGPNELGVDYRVRADGTKEPLAVGGYTYGRGIGMHAPSRATYAIDGSYARFRAIVGLAPSSIGKGTVQFVVQGDGRTLFRSPVLRTDSAPLEVDVDVSDVRRLTLIAEPTDDGHSFDHANWVDAVLLGNGRVPPPSSRLSATVGSIGAAGDYHESVEAYSWRGALPEGVEGMALVPLDPFGDVDPAGPLSTTGAVSMAAALGESEAGAALLVSRDPQAAVDIEAGPLMGPGGARIDASRLTVRRAIRSPMRRYYGGQPTDTVVTSRFLVPWKPLDIPPREFREVWVEVAVPSDTPPGRYHGALEAKSQAQSISIPVVLDVRSFELDEPRDSRHGIYYQFAQTLADPERVRREVADLRAHGVGNLVTDLQVQYFPDGEGWRPDGALLRRGLSELRASGFSGTVVVGTGLDTLARTLGHRDPSHPGALDADSRFQAAAQGGIALLASLQAEYPQMRLAVTHLDEIFDGSDRAELYAALSRPVRHHSELPLYITIATARTAQDALRERIDPYVDIRSHHGYSFEGWLLRGHTMAEYEAELNASGDEAWLYHNQRGPWFTPEWSRIVNGIYLWASPFRVHAPWAYQSVQGDPFDELDGKEADTVMSLPSPGDAAILVPTRIWEGFREGHDDLRYIATLERLIEEQRARRPEAATAARRDLDRLRALVRGETIPGGTTPARSDLDLDSPLRPRSQKGLGPSEAPWLQALADRFDARSWAALRAMLSGHIEALRPKD